MSTVFDCFGKRHQNRPVTSDPKRAPHPRRERMSSLRPFAVSLTGLWLASLPVVMAADPTTPLVNADFESVESISQLKAWEFLDPDTWSVRQIDGNRTIAITARASGYRPPVRSPGHVALLRDVDLDHFEITFRVRSLKDTGGHRDCCVFFNYQDAQHFYYVHLGAAPDPHSGQIMIVNEAPRLALTKNRKPTPWADAWHRVKLVRNGTTGEIKVFFDDMNTPHMRVVDRTFRGGRVGIGSFDDLNEFDDVMVRDLSE